MSPYIKDRKCVKIGGSLYISIPKEWLEANNLKEANIEKLLVIANKDIRIVNPERREEVYIKVTKMVEEAEV